MTTTSNPVDAAQPGDVFRDPNGVTWMLTDCPYIDAWITSSLIDDERHHTWNEALEANLTRLVPEDAQATAEWLIAEARHQLDASIAGSDAAIAGTVRSVRDGDGFTAQLDGVLIAKCDTYGRIANIPVDASDPAHLRHAADLLQSLYRQANWSVAQIEALSEVITLIANRADRLDADTKDRADRELAGRVIAERFPTDEVPAIAEFVLAGIRAGRAAAKAVQA